MTEAAARKDEDEKRKVRSKSRTQAAAPNSKRETDDEKHRHFRRATDEYEVTDFKLQNRRNDS